MAEKPNQKTESTKDAATNSGPSSTPVGAAGPGNVKLSAAEERILDLEASIERLRADLGDRDAFLEKAAAKLGESIGAGVANALRAEREGKLARVNVKRELPEKYRGPRSYIVGPNGAYQGIRRFVQGERITVVDQFPAKDWTPIEKADEAPAQAAPAKQGRASDQSVG